jgi:hypothetical protein
MSLEAEELEYKRWFLEVQEVKPAEVIRVGGAICTCVRWAKLLSLPVPRRWVCSKYLGRPLEVSNQSQRFRCIFEIFVSPFHSTSRSVLVNSIWHMCQTAYLHAPGWIVYIVLRVLADRMPTDSCRLLSWHLIFKGPHSAERKRVGKKLDATSAIVDSQGVKTTEEVAA